MTKIKAWHFVANNRRLAHEPDVKVAPGYIYTSDQPIVICKSGLHASRTVYDALQYATGEYLCRVKCWGGVAEQSDKLVARNRHVIAARDVAAELRLWACWCVRQQWHLLTDERSRRAVEVAESFARGEATNEDLAAAWDSARDSAWSAAARDAWSAAWSAARDAAAKSARSAWSAAARDAAWDSARDAARDAAARAAWDAAARAAWDAQKKELERRMLVLFGEGV